MRNQFRRIQTFVPQITHNYLKEKCPRSSFSLVKTKFNFSTSSSFKNNKSNIFQNDVKLILNQNWVKPKIIDDEETPLTEEEKECIENLKQPDCIYPYNSRQERAKQVLKEDLKLTGKELVNTATGIKLGSLELEYFPKETDVLVIGSGIIGLSIAYALKKEFPFGYDVLVMDKNEYAPITTSLASGTLMQQSHNEEIELEMAKYCVEFLSSFSRHTKIPGHNRFDISYDPMGSLVLADENCADDVLSNFDLLQKHSIPASYLKSADLKKLFSWLNVKDNDFGTLGTMNEGTFDPHQVRRCMKAKLVNMGVKFVTAEVIDFGYNDKRIRRVVCKLPDGSFNSTDFSRCVIACGSGSQKLVKAINNIDDVILKMRFPIEKKLKYEFCFHCPSGPGLNTPILKNTDGVYFRREGLSGLYIIGVSSIPVSNDKQSDIYEVFDSKVKPFIMTRLPDFRDLELRHGWIEEYTTNTANDIGIIGPHPCNNEIYFAIGFTKNGLLYGPAVGRGLMEYMIHSGYQTIDFTILHAENLYLKQHLEAQAERKLLELEKQLRIGEA